MGLLSKIAGLLAEDSADYSKMVVAPSDFKAIKRRLQKGMYPDEVAKRILSGELDMRSHVVKQRAIDQGYDLQNRALMPTGQLEYHPPKSGESPYTPLGPSFDPNGTTKWELHDAAMIDQLGQAGYSVPKYYDTPFLHNTGRRSEPLYKSSWDDDVELLPIRGDYNNPKEQVRHSMAAFDPKYVGPNTMGGALAGAVGLGALGQSEDADAGPLSKAAKIAALRAEANAARFGDEVDVSYRGDHVAPTAEYGAPLHNLTDMIPEDVYGPDGQRLYGVGDAAVDNESFDVLHAVRGNPDAEVTMYRAVPSDAPDAIADGDWVTTSRTYAEQHGDRTLGGDYKILEEPTYARRLQSEGYPYEFGYMENGRATLPLLGATALGSAGLLAAPALMKDGVFQHGATSEPVVERREPVRNQSGLLADVTDFGDEVFKSVRHAAGPLADVFMPYEGVNNYLKTVNDYDRQPTWWDRLGILDL